MAGARFAAAWLAATTVVSISLPMQSEAQIQQPEPIDKPLPEGWRGPLAVFLRSFGARDVQAIVDGAKFGPLLHLDSTAILRLEHSSACFEEICITIIAQLKEQNLDSKIMFTAGKWVTRGDVLPQILGTSVSPPLLFYTTSNPSTEAKGVALAETGQGGWIVFAGPQ